MIVRVALLGMGFKIRKCRGWGCKTEVGDSFSGLRLFGVAFFPVQELLLIVDSETTTTGMFTMTYKKPIKGCHYTKSPIMSGRQRTTWLADQQAIAVLWAKPGWWWYFGQSWLIMTKKAFAAHIFILYLSHSSTFDGRTMRGRDHTLVQQTYNCRLTDT